MKKKLVIGTRDSKLALWQANYVAGAITRQYPQMAVALEHIATKGDKLLNAPLAKLGGKGLFTQELELAMLAGRVDLAVHSLKDVPAVLPPGLKLAAVTSRLDPGDALVSPRYHTIDNLPWGAKVGTSSLRRKAQLLHYRPDLAIHDLRGNVDTRLRKLEELGLDAIVLAVAGLKRLGWDDRITATISREICLPAVGQGALAIEIRDNDLATQEIVNFLNDRDTQLAVAAERAFLCQLGGNCQIPVGVYGRIQEEQLLLEAAILSVDGSRKLYNSITGSPAEAEGLGRRLAEKMQAAGGGRLLAKLETSGRKGE